MSNLSRRSALLGFTAAGAAISVALAQRPALAQTQPASGGNYSDYVTQTLTVGTLALKSSEVAAQKATDPMVKEFAGLEVGEQKAIASVLASTEAGKSPPQLPQDQQAKLDDLNKKEGADFDSAYVQMQVDGHNQLLQIQKTISGQTEATVETITARLAEQAVTSHIAMLKHIQQSLSGGSGSSSGGGQQSGGQQSGGQSGGDQSGGQSGGGQSGGQSGGDQSGGQQSGGQQSGGQSGGQQSGGQSGGQTQQ